MSEERITMDGDAITQALEDMRERYAVPETSQSEKSRKAVIEDIKAMLTAHPEMSNRDIRH